jgi:sulfotransferase
MKTFYFMAGLPRSGSTLLSSILNQNPRFYSGPSSPVLGAMYAVEENFTNNELYTGYPKPNQVREIIGSIPHHFYSDVQQPVVFDKNRAWTARVPYIEGYIGQQAKIIVPVRRIDEILTSILSMIHRNPYQEGQPRINFVDEQLVKTNIPINDYNRCMYLLNGGGIVYESLNAIMEGFTQNVRDRMHFVDYNDLVNKPQETMEKIYEFLNEDSYEHRFDSLHNIHREDDLTTYGLSDMHEVRTELEKTSPPPASVLPKEILNLYEENKNRLEFWGTPDIIKLEAPKVKAPDTKNNKVFINSKVKENN